MLAPASTSWRVPCGGDDVAGDDRGVGGDAAHGLDRAQRALLVAVGGVDDEDVDAHLAQRFGLDVDAVAGRRAVDPDGDGEHQATLGIDCGSVDRRSQCAVAGDHADQPALVVDHRGERATLRREQLEGRDRLDPVGHGDDVAAHGGVQLGEAVVAGGVRLAEHSKRRAAFVDDDDRAVGPLVDQGEGVADRVVWRQRDRRLVQRVAALDVVDDRADDVEGDVLGQHGQPAAAGHGLGHPPAGDGGHVGDDDRERRADPVGRREVDVEARTDRRQVRDHEHVVVRQVVAGVGVEQPHDRSRLRSRRSRSGRPPVRFPIRAASGPVSGRWAAQFGDEVGHRPRRPLLHGSADDRRYPLRLPGEH